MELTEKEKEVGLIEFYKVTVKDLMPQSQSDHIFVYVFRSLEEAISHYEECLKKNGNLRQVFLEKAIGLYDFAYKGKCIWAKKEDNEDGK